MVSEASSLTHQTIITSRVLDKQTYTIHTYIDDNPPQEIVDNDNEQAKSYASVERFNVTVFKHFGPPTPKDDFDPALEPDTNIG
ncbi:hypothetical protein GB937_002355 [Aspergillus fischeri]|nr:hypothetical protein GB937_002355 [Aspergillus fischeri]